MNMHIVMAGIAGLLVGVIVGIMLGYVLTAWLVAGLTQRATAQLLNAVMGGQGRGKQSAEQNGIDGTPS